MQRRQRRLQPVCGTSMQNPRALSPARAATAGTPQQWPAGKLQRQHSPVLHRHSPRRAASTLGLHQQRMPAAVLGLSTFLERRAAAAAPPRPSGRLSEPPRWRPQRQTTTGSPPGSPRHPREVEAVASSLMGLALRYRPPQHAFEPPLMSPGRGERARGGPAAAG